MTLHINSIDLIDETARRGIDTILNCDSTDEVMNDLTMRFSSA